MCNTWLKVIGQMGRPFLVKLTDSRPEIVMMFRAGAGVGI
jgi:hypothetical protein